MREVLFLRPGQHLVQRYAFQRNPQRRAVAQTPVTQRGRRLRRFHRGSPFLPAAPDTPPWSGWIRETAGGFHRVGPVPRPAAIPIRIGDVLAPPGSAPPPTRRKRGNGWRAVVRAPDPRDDTWPAGPARVRLHLCHGAWCGLLRRGTGLPPGRTRQNVVSATRVSDGDRARENARQACAFPHWFRKDTTRGGRSPSRRGRRRSVL